MAVNSVSIRIEEEMLEKLGYVAEYEGRSLNSQILVLVRECIQKYEADHGEISGRVKPDVNVKTSGRYRKQARGNRSGCFLFCCLETCCFCFVLTQNLVASGDSFIPPFHIYSALPQAERRPKEWSCTRNHKEKTEREDFNVNRKNKFALRITPETQKLVKDLCPRDNCQSQNEFIDKASRF